MNQEEAFEEFWSVKPKRDGDNPKQPALKSFRRAVKDGVDPMTIISAAREWRDQIEKKRKLGTEVVPMAVTWLNQKRWENYAAAPEPVAQPSEQFRCFVKLMTPEWEAWQKFLKATG